MIALNLQPNPQPHRRIMKPSARSELASSVGPTLPLSTRKKNPINTPKSSLHPSKFSKPFPHFEGGKKQKRKVSISLLNSLRLPFRRRRFPFSLF